ncbi:PrsW family glutamic-type intramembrane protease [Corynebacterium minutissimum]|uniref:PrsW family glutamic-type intramembrane protease n=1 Tax=Corynebacterium minutissimum TaxID=38301 RepID=UPI001EF3798C|nr:PrsW family glutamic-type intramembrane protease [Corynebacterium minutissimum]MCG7228870.1 PrsW family intramembrane metalloprotease [Corynebacterium minutissimum]MCG7237987.1 PrsW family intramembrane metalloprotease [Corynebacterium minutissimum]
MRRTQTLYELLTAAGLVFAVYDFSQGPFVTTSALAAVLYAAVAIGLTLLILRKHPGIAHGVVWGIAVSSVAGQLNESMNHLLIRTVPDWLVIAGIAPLNEEVLKFLGVIFICTCVIRPRRWADYVFVGVAVGMGFSVSENAVYYANMTLENLDSDVRGTLLALLARFIANPLMHSFFTGIAAYGLSRRQPVRWLLIAMAVHFTANLGPSISTAFEDALWPIFPTFLILIGLWVATIVSIVKLRKILPAEDTDTKPQLIGSKA